MAEPQVSDGRFASLSGARALVTGGLGFIGSALCRRLEILGAEVHTVSRQPAPAGSKGRHWQMDLSDFPATDRLVREVQPRYVFHLASHVMGAPDLKHVLPAFSGNLQTTVNLLTSLASVGCARFITTGSLVEPESTGRSIPNSPYAAAKWASSDYARMFHALYRFPAAIARVFMVYGPGQWDMTKLVPYVISSIMSGEPARITSGEHRIDWIFVEDVVEGFLKLAITPDIDGESADLGSGAPVTIRQIVDEIYRLMAPDTRPVYGALPDRPMEPIRVANVARSTSLIGWSPQVDLTTGLQRTIEWYRAKLAT